MLALDEVLYHAALQRAGPVERVQRAQIFHASRLVLAQNVAHAARFELEHAARVPLRKNLVRLRVVEWEIVDRKFRAGVDRNQVQSILNDVERREAEKIHLEKR